MEDCTRVVLYGTFDGAAFSTDNFLQIAVILDSGEKVEIPTECVTSADQIVKKDEIKLKDVIKRIEKFDLGTKAVWINEILNELGSDYGTFKYKDGYEQGKFDGAVEREKVTIPQFVADWYEEHKDDFETELFRAVDLIPSDYEEGELSEFEEWLVDEHTAPFQTLVNMHQFGYVVKKENRYSVKVRGVDSCFECLYYGMGSNTWSFRMEHESGYFRTSHTLKELEQAGFGWVFDCPGMEVEEVEDDTKI